MSESSGSMTGASLKNPTLSGLIVVLILLIIIMFLFIRFRRRCCVPYQQEGIYIFLKRFRLVDNVRGADFFRVVGVFRVVDIFRGDSVINARSYTFIFRSKQAHESRWEFAVKSSLWIYWIWSIKSGVDQCFESEWVSLLWGRWDWFGLCFYARCLIF